MFKFIGRTLAILCVCGLVAGGVYALVQTHSSIGVHGERPEFQAQADSEGGRLPQGAPPAGHFHGDEAGGDVGRGLAGLVGNFLVIAVIIAAVAGAQRLPARLFAGRSSARR